MTAIAPAAARLISSAWVTRVPSPLHDAIDPVTRATTLATNPHSWLHVVQDATAITRLLNDEIYSPEENSYFIYRYHDRLSGHEQTGVVAAVPITEFLNGEVLGHESVEPDRVKAIVDHHRNLQVRGDLVALLIEDDPLLASILNEIASAGPAIEIPGELTHQIWRVDHQSESAISTALARHRLYIIDGHHRVAAAIDEWRERGEPQAYTVLCLITAQSQLRALSFDRRIVGPLTVDPIAALSEHSSELSEISEPTRRAGWVSVYHDQRWYELRLNSHAHEGVEALDVIRLHEDLLEPAFGVKWSDPRLEVTSERAGVDLLQYRCDNDGGVAFIMHAPTVEQIVAVADRGEQMPPKSTYFDPKPWSGVLIAAPDGGKSART